MIHKDIILYSQAYQPLFARIPTSISKGINLYSQGYQPLFLRMSDLTRKDINLQSRAYQAVLKAQEESIDQVRVGVRYRNVHWTACRILTEFLIDEGILNCDVDEALEHGSHALFFPHGIGHLIGLDVHDMEHFGDIPSYPNGRIRSKQFGTAYLRLDADLKENMVVTIEPGFYIIPAILENKKLMMFRGNIWGKTKLMKFQKF